MIVMQGTDTLEIAVLAHPDAQASVVVALAECFEYAEHLREELGMRRSPQLRLTQWARTATGFARCHDTLPGAPGTPNLVFIAPCYDAPPAEDSLQTHAEQLRAWHREGTILLAVCSGAWLLAASGLLDRRQATLNALQASDLARAYPAIKVLGAQPLHDDGDLVTSAGKMAWLDLAVAVLARYFGTTLAAEVSALYRPEASICPQRPANPFQPRFNHGHAAVLRVQQWLQGNQAKGVSLDEMAQCAGLEPRTFLRKFQACTGLKPTEYCQHLRVGRACDLLALTQRSVDQVAWCVGYGDVGALRKVFLRITGLALSEYRERYGLRQPFKPVALKGRRDGF
jgi:transcriptional regulator GlxA family with amidase domain